MADEKRELTDTRLSYSSYQTLKGCEQKYWHYKINNTPHDLDFNDEKESLVMGKAFHSILEGAKHDPNISMADLGAILSTVFNETNLDEDRKALVVAMVKVYLQFRGTNDKFRALKPVGIEVKLQSDDFIGFADVVFEDNKGNWYIGDLKTTARQSETLKSRLQMDAQLHLYSSYAPQLAEELKLDISKFAGALYITTNKTTTKRKANEVLSDYVNRLMGAIETRIYVVPIDKTKTEWVVSDFKESHKRTQELRNGTEPTPKRNYSRCEDYFTPCAYFSQCHGHNYSEAKLEIWSSNG